MLSNLHGHIRQNVVAYLALFFALSGGVAWATHQGGANTISSGDIQNGQVTTPDLANLGVTTPKLADSAVTTPKLANSAVTSAKLNNSAVTNAKLAANAVSSGNVRDDTVTGGGLAAVDLRPDSVAQSEIAAGGVASAELADGAVTTQKVGNIPAARGAKTVDQSIPHYTGNLTALTFEAESFDSDSLHDNSVNNSRLTASKSGVYQVTAGVDWGFSATGIRHLSVVKNGDLAEAGGTSHINASQNGHTRQTASDLVRLSAGDYVEAYVFQTSGGPLAATADFDRTFLAMTWAGHG